MGGRGPVARDERERPGSRDQNRTDRGRDPGSTPNATGGGEKPNATRRALLPSGDPLIARRDPPMREAPVTGDRLPGAGDHRRELPRQGRLRGRNAPMVPRRIAVAATAALLLAGCAAQPGASSAPRTLSAVSAHIEGPQTPPVVTAVDFVDRMHGWLGCAATAVSTGEPAGEGALLATSDGGRSWTHLAQVRGAIRAIDFVTAPRVTSSSSGRDASSSLPAQTAAAA